LNHRPTLRTGLVVLSAAAVVLSGVVAVYAARLVQVQRARYSVQGLKTRVVLDLDGPTEYKITTHKNPDRLAVNIPDTRAAKSFPRLVLDAGVVERIRVNRLSWGTQVVLDLTKPAHWKDFSLRRNGNLPDRIVVDVFDTQPRQTVRRSDPVPATPSAGKNDLYIVAVDAGHGGKDPGTSKVEKSLNLDMAKRIARRIDAIAGFNAVLTRKSDVYLDLNRRVDIAASKNADVFVSVHVNYARNRAARGVEVFFLSPRGANVTTSRVLSNPTRAANEFGLSGAENADLLHMLVDVNKQSVMTRSELLAESILESMNKKGLPPTRSVKQRSFSVLRTFETPSVLVETGFLSNKYDAKILRSPDGRQRLAEAIVNGIVSYFTEFPPPRGRHEPVIVHRVSKGETLWRISRKYSTSVASIRRANNLGSSSMLRPGQELIISSRY
jgi:N-acetylmuramoyl-L-alanine amidase